MASFLALVFSGVQYKPPQGTAVAPTEVDFIVVGGGSGGSVVASRLSEVKKWQVLLLEAGPEEPVVQQIPALSSHTYTTKEYDWQLKVEKTANDFTGVIPRAKMLGGCSAHNGMVYQRGTAGDFKCWVKSGATGWGFEDVLPFYKKSENNLDPDIAKNTKFHSTGGPLSVQRVPYEDANVKLLREAYKSSGLAEVDLNADVVEGFAWSQTTTKQGHRNSANMAFLSEPRKTRKNLHILTNSFVKKIRVDPKTKRAVAVEFTDRKGATKVVKARLEVILSAGTFLSPQILMASGIGPSNQLKKAGIPVVVKLNSVGRNLQDHVLPNAMPTIHFTRTATVPNVTQMKADAKAFAKGGGPLTMNGPNQLVVRVRSPLQPKHDDRAYVQVQHGADWENRTNLIPFCKQATSSVNTTSCYYNKVNVNVVLLHPKDSGRVKLNATNPYGPPLIYQKILTSKQDVRAIAAGLKQITERLTASKALRNAGAKVSLPNDGAACGKNTVGSQAWYECVVRTGGGASWGHGVGTCSIGKVVDPRLRVLGGVKGLRVADASVMPCVPSGNTNGPSMMIGERAASFIKQDHGMKS